MKIDNSHIAANVTFKAGGGTYSLAPLTIKDFKELEDEFRTESLRLVKRQLDGLPSEDRQFLLAKAYGEMDSIRIGSAKFNEAATTVHGITYMFFLSLRKHQPDVTKDQALELFGLADPAELTEKVKQIAGYREGNAGTGAVQQP